MSNIEGLYVIGEANFSDHGANRLGASALMQGLADGYFVLPYSIGDYLATKLGRKDGADSAAFKDAEKDVQGRIRQFLDTKGTRSVDSYHRELGSITWDYCGMSRTAEGLKGAISRIASLRHDFWRNVKVLGEEGGLNQSLEKAGRVADYFELAELMCLDALQREESAGGHFRTEHQTPEGEARRNDDDYAYVAAWEFGGEGAPPVLHKEKLEFENVHLTQRSYK